MNYGYDKTIEGWKPEKEMLLGHKLSDMLDRENFKPKKGYENYTPYIEQSGFYDGIRIRRITHLTKEDQTKLVKEADKIYDEIMLKV